MNRIDTETEMEDFMHINIGKKDRSEILPAFYAYKVCHLSFVCVNSTDEGPGLDKHIWNSLSSFSS